MNGERYRHELKFICSETQLQLLEDRIRHVCERDPHASEYGIYQIRSLYFDSYDDACYYENKSGTNNRHKYRIRIYNADHNVIKLERKGSVNGLKCKESCLLTKSQCEQMINGFTVEEVSAEQVVLQEFLVEQRMALLSPKVIVEYERTPYIYPIGNVRITFDRYIAAADVKFFWEKDTPQVNVMAANKHILEVKYDDILPGTILELLNSVGDLHRTSFSKYTVCRDCFI